MVGRAAREELWRRYDAGTINAAQLDARLKAVDRAGDDPLALAAALDGPVTRRGPAGTSIPQRPVVVAILIVVGLVVVSALLLLRDGSGDDRAINGTADTAGSNPQILPAPPPVQLAPDCPAGDDAAAILEEIDADELPANPALLSDPPALPEGYEVTDEVTVAPGTEPNVAMAVYAGSPAPTEILARDIVGALLVTMRSFRYDSVKSAERAAEFTVRTGACSYDQVPAPVPEHPGISSSVVGGIIPTTAFASFRLGDRRVVVAVPVGVEDDDAAAQAAQDLAIQLAAAELEAAKTERRPR